MTWLSGYGARTEPAKGKVHDLYAKAAAFEDAAGSRLVLVTLDLGSVNPNTTEYVAAECEKKFKLPRARLVLNCSHTHCAPEVSAERRVFLGSQRRRTRQAHALYRTRSIRSWSIWLERPLPTCSPPSCRSAARQAGFAFNRRGPKGIDKNGAVGSRSARTASRPINKANSAACCSVTPATTRQCAANCIPAIMRDSPNTTWRKPIPARSAMFVMGCGGDQNPQPRHGDKEAAVSPSNTAASWRMPSKRAIDGELHERRRDHCELPTMSPHSI